MIANEIMLFNTMERASTNSKHINIIALCIYCLVSRTADGIQNALNIAKPPNCLCGISTRHLELLIWITRFDSPTYLQGCTTFFLKLNNEYNENKWNKVLLPFVTTSTTRWQTSPDSLKPYKAYTERKMLDCQALLWSSSSNCLVLIPHGQLGNHLPGTGESYGPIVQHIHKNLYRSMLDTYWYDDYSLKPKTTYCMNPGANVQLWCK